jgi:two-component system phosphate regulon response regulator PhoB
MAKILFIEDDEPTRTMVTAVLRRAGHEAVDAPDAEEGLAIIDRDRPDLLLLDIGLPGISGIEVCARLKQSTATARLPVIMLTAFGHHTAKVRGLDTGADDYMVKPVKPSELVARVDALLRRYGGR